MAVYTKDKKNRVTLRLNDEQFAYVTRCAEDLDVAPSDFLRMVINVAMVSQDKFNQKVGEGLGRENDIADKHD